MLWLKEITYFVSLPPLHPIMLIFVWCWSWGLWWFSFNLKYWYEVVGLIPVSWAVVQVAVPGPKNHRHIHIDVWFLWSLITGYNSFVTEGMSVCVTFWIQGEYRSANNSWKSQHVHHYRPFSVPASSNSFTFYSLKTILCVIKSFKPTLRQTLDE